MITQDHISRFQVLLASMRQIVFSQPGSFLRLLKQQRLCLRCRLSHTMHVHDSWCRVGLVSAFVDILEALPASNRPNIHLKQAKLLVSS